MSMHLDPRKPLWQMHLVEHCEQGSAIIIRFEHAVADGDASMVILNLLTDPEPDWNC